MRYFERFAGIYAGPYLPEPFAIFVISYGQAYAYSVFFTCAVGDSSDDVYINFICDTGRGSQCKRNVVKRFYVLLVVVVQLDPSLISYQRVEFGIIEYSRILIAQDLFEIVKKSEV